MTDKEENEKKVKITFAPGCFDNFEGSQEELDELMAEIVKMFTELSPEEIMERSTPLTVDDLEEMYDDEPEVVEQIVGSMADKRKLQ